MQTGHLSGRHKSVANRANYVRAMHSSFIVSLRETREGDLLAECSPDQQSMHQTDRYMRPRLFLNQPMGLGTLLIHIDVT